MIGYLKAARAARVAKRQYELAVLESLIAENERQMERFTEPEECRLCKKMEDEREAAAGG